MTEDDPAPGMLQVIAHTLFISAPAIFLAAYGVYRARGWLATEFNFKVPGLIYMLVVALAISGVMWVTTGRLISKLRKPRKPNRPSNGGGPVV